MFVDARVPVVVGDGAMAPGDVVLVLAEDVRVPEGGHLSGCACCLSHSDAAAALMALFQSRARGRVPWFGRVVAVCGSAHARAGLEAALNAHPFVSGRFRMEAAAPV